MNKLKETNELYKDSFCRFISCGNEPRHNQRCHQLPVMFLGPMLAVDFIP